MKNCHLVSLIPGILLTAGITFAQSYQTTITSVNSGVSGPSPACTVITPDGTADSVQVSDSLTCQVPYNFDYDWASELERGICQCLQFSRWRL